ncbi:MAG: universal stress protein [Planctomycetota bacterium]|nr:universal stress protein [Planctomycetota bacterium]MDA1177169.1 universal stress protein [Planctomycetota bacterium]
MNWFENRRIVAPFDFSSESISSVEMACQLATKSGDIHVLHVIPHLTATDPGVIWETVDDERRKDHARTSVEKTLKEHGVDVENIHIDIGVGDPGTIIVDLAEEVEAGIIVIPSHGRTGLSRVIMGSVAERVVRHALCPVLVLKKKAK